jgi:hypothetical protein
MMRPPGLLAAFLLVAALVACSAELPAGSQTLTDDAGPVTVTATWLGPTAGLAIELALDTHSVDLDRLQLTDALLRNDRGETLAGAVWSAQDGDHHRSGPLRFAGDSAAFLTDARWVELVLPDVGDGTERRLRWALEPGG